MSKAKQPRVLVAAGDYDIVHQTQQALQNERFSIYRAYTHRDALYALEYNAFDLVVLDSAMFDRYTGDSTLASIARLKRELPLVAFALQGGNESTAQLTDDVITRLDKAIILETVQRALKTTNRSQTQEVPTLSNAATSDKALTRRMEELRTLFVLSQSLTEVLDLTEVLNRVVEAARRLTNADEGMILLPDDDAGALYLRAKVGIDVEVARNFRIKTQDNLVGQVFKSGKPILVGDQGPQKVKTEYFVNSLLYVPILRKGTPIGVLGVNNKTKEGVFDLNQQELLMNLASFAAIAIENARIHEDSLQRAREMETLVEVSQSLNSSLSLQETLPNICRQLAQVLTVNRTEILEWDRDARRLAVLARFQRTLWSFGQGPTVSLKQLPALQHALRHNRPFWVTHEDIDKGEETRYLHRIGAGAMLVVPVYSQERVLGALRVFYITVPNLTPQPDAMHNISNLALEGLANLLGQGEQSRFQNVFRLLEQINRLTNADWSDLSSVAGEGDRLVLHMELGNGVWLEPPYPQIDVQKYPDITYALESQLLISHNPDDGQITSGVKAFLDTTASRAILGIPLVQRGQTQGLVLVSDTERNRVFGKREVDMGRAIVGQAATALENAHLVRDLELSLQELKDTQDRLVQTARLSAMGELAAVVAHQINNPLTTIVVDTELLMLDEPKESRNYGTLESISRAGKRAAGVAKRLLAIARPNDPEALTEPIDVVDTVRGVLSLVKTHIERDRVKVLEKLPDNPVPHVEAVRGQLDDVWLNLLMNAHDALVGQEGAQIGIEVAYNARREQVEVLVWDNGPGIPEHIKTQIFNPFFTTKPVGEGTGLGLHICRQVVERVGGKIWVESEAGRGSRFYIQLPAIRSDRYGVTSALVEES